MGLPEKRRMVSTSPVYDIGMTEISDEILNKALRLTGRNAANRRQARRGDDRPLEFVKREQHHSLSTSGGTAALSMGLKGENRSARASAVIGAFQS
jgi:hypothetical protein